MAEEGVAQPTASDTSTVGFIPYQRGETIRPAVDIVFISSLNGQSKARPSAWKSFHWYWPEALIDSLPNARVLVWCLPPGIQDLTKKSSIEEASKALLEDIKKQRAETAERPLLFIAHSLGGVILQRALLTSQETDDFTHYGTLLATKGVCFFGTPQAGNGDTWRHAITSVRRALAARALVSLSPRTSSEYSEDDEMGMYSRAFRRLVNKSRIPILTFYETEKTPTNRGEVLIVGKDQAKLQAVNEQLVSRHADHTNIAKFDNNRDRGYRIVCEFVVNCVPDSVAAGLQQPFVTGKTTFMSESQVDNAAQRSTLLDSLRFDWLPEQEVADWLPGTCDWVLDTDEWRNWQAQSSKPPQSSKSSQSSEPLWIVGDPGMGKSVLARYILRELRNGQHQQHRINPKHVFGYFFDSRVDARQEFDGLVRALLYRFLSLDLELFRHVRPRDTPKDNDTFSEHTTQKSRIEILTSILADPTVGTVVLLLEGLDECSSPTDASMVRFIQNIKAFSNVQLIITSRPEKNIEEAYKPLSSFSIILDANSKFPRSSIRQYVSQEIRLVLGDKGFPREFLESLQDVLLRRQTPTFLWVRLAIRYIELQRTTFLSRSVMEKLPTGPDVFPLFRRYLLTEHLFEKIPFPSIYIVMEAHRPLSVSALSFMCAAVFKDQSELMKKGKLKLIDIEESTIRNFSHEVKRFPFLQVQDDLVALMHNTLKGVLKHKDMDKIFNNKDYDTSLGRTMLTQDLVDSAKAGMNSFLARLHYLIAELCLKYLLVSLRESRDPLDFLKYASLYWFEHFRQAGHYEAKAGQTRKPKTPKALIRAIETLLESNEACKDWSVVPRKTDDTLFTKWIRLYRTYDIAQKRRLIPLPNTSNPKTFVLAAFDLFEVLGADLLNWSMDSMICKDKHDHTPLHFIVANNSLASLKWIQKKAPLDQFHSYVMATQNPDGKIDSKQCPVYIAVEYGNRDMVKLFIQSMKGAPLKSKQFLASLHAVAARKGHRDTFLALYDSGFLELLEGEARKDVAYSAVQLDCIVQLNQLLASPKNTNMPSDEKLLRFAIRTHAGNTARELISKVEDIGKPSNQGRTVLHEAAEAGNEELTNTIIKLLEEKSDLKNAAMAINAIDNAKQSALHLASQGGYINVCQALLNHGARINLIDRSGCLPVHYAAMMGNDTILDLLLENGSNLFTSDEQGRSPLHFACEGGYESTVRLLLDKNARHRARDTSGSTPLHYAVKTGNVSIVWMLIDAGADVHVGDDNHIAPLHLAATGSSDVMLTQLLSLGADPNSQDKNARTPLHYAVSAGHLRNTVLLIEAKADVEAKDDEDITPLHLAAEGPSEGVVTALLRAHADPSAKDNKGKSIYYYCLRNRPPSRVVLRALMASKLKFDFREMDIPSNKELRECLREFGTQVINISPDLSRASTDIILADQEITGPRVGTVEDDTNSEFWNP